MPLDGPRALKLGKHTVDIRWSNRAAYRIETIRPRPRLEDINQGSGFAFLCAYVWAMLDRETDRRRFTDPEAIAGAIDTKDENATKALWRAVFLEAFDFDPDAPKPAPATATAPDPEAGAPADPPR